MERAEQVTDRDAPARGPVEPATPVRPERPLDLAGVSPDRTRLLLVDDGGATYTLPVTPGLRAALRGDAPRLGQLENPMESTLRPRDIQTRIRSGETAEAVAEAAGTSVDKIMPFVAPVLAERQHVAERAQRSTVRRPAGESAPSGPGGRMLGDAVEAHLRALNIDPEGVDWDAWRREDGRWTLTAGYAVAARTGSAHFTFDMPGNYVVLDDEDARWLVGDVVASPAPTRDDLQSVRERRLSTITPEASVETAVADTDQDELPLGDDAIDLVAEPFPVDEQMPLEAFFDDSPDSDDPELREEAAEAAAAEPEPDPEPVAAPVAEEPQPARRTVQKKKGRASVPSWDEIMFGPRSD